MAMVLPVIAARACSPAGLLRRPSARAAAGGGCRPGAATLRPITSPRAALPRAPSPSWSPARLGRGGATTPPPGRRGRGAVVTASAVVDGDGGLGIGVYVSVAALALVMASTLGGGDDKKKGAGDIATGALAAGLETVKNTPNIAMAGQKKWVKLAAALLIDIVGVASFALPGAGELGDVAWAPVSAILVQALYNNTLISVLDFVEEALPFSDIIPTATLGWAVEYTVVGAALSFIPGMPDRKGEDKGGD